MISLSNLIKSSAYTPSVEIRRIDINEIVAAMREAAADKQAGSAAAADETEAIREEMLRDAREMAEQMIARAREEAELMKARALEEIEAWWSTRREEDRQVVEEARARGYDEGYAAGKAEAEAAVREQHAGTLAEAKAVLETAVAQKQAIIREAEPFLVELSCSIASKIIGRQLTLEPEWTIDMIKSVLGRRREKGTIALCVSPQQFSFVNDARDELRKVVDSQAELLVVADATVQDHGCVVRSEFGSLDARIDTQLEEVRNALLNIAASDGERDGDE